jgi:dihydrofolate reductase
MRISIVAAVGRNGVIGRGGALPWRLSDDLKRFRRITSGKPVIMGRKTYDSIGKPLPDRCNIVVSRTAVALAGAQVARSVEDALQRAEDARQELGAEEICVIGGADIFRAALPSADRIYLTEVDADTEGDVYFPPIDPSEWTRRFEGEAPRSMRNEHTCRFFVLDRRATASPSPESGWPR